MKSFLVVGFIALGSIAIANPTKSIVGARYASNIIEDVSYDATSYVQDGLIALFDGVWNAGYNMHDTNPSEWVDLIQGRSLVFDQYCQAGDNCIFNSMAGSRNTPAFATMPDKSLSEELMGIDEFTIEISEDATSIDSYYVWTSHLITICSGGTYGYTIFLQQYNNRIISRGIFGELSITGYFAPHVISIVVQRNSTNSYYINAELFKGGVVPKPATDESTIKVKIGITYKTYCIRIYNRKLSQAEIMHNYSIDKIRFNLP